MKQIFIVLIIIAVVASGAATMESPKINVHVVRIVGTKFIPKSLDVKVGETVRWINESNSSHNVIADDGDFKSDWLDDRGDTFEYTFKKEGVFHYYCQPHRMMGMKGILIIKK